MNKIKSPWDQVVSNYYEDFINYKINKIKKFNTNYQADLDNYIHTINSVFNNFKVNKSINTLLFGFIQSGKTDFIIGIITKYCSDYKGNLIISINQSNKDLLNQTIKRTIDIYNKNIYTFKTMKNEFSFIKKKLINNENIVIFLFKNKYHLEEILSLIDELKKDNIAINKSLIIDDESDSASLNDIKKDDPTLIYSLITKIKNKLEANYLSITATPFAQILLDKNDYLKPNYVYMLYPSSGYTGLDYFVNTYNEGYKPNFIEIEDINKEEHDELIINKDFEKAIKTYIVQCFWWTYLFKKESKARMLINIAKAKLVHEDIFINTKNLINKIKDKYQIDENYFKDIFNNLDIDISYEQLFKQKFEEIISKITPFILNGDNKDNVNLDNEEKTYYRIIIGQNKLNRGLTIVDLINTFISSRSIIHANADVILQQARFIGYREQYKEKIRIFLTKSLINDYLNINENLQYFQSIINSNHEFDKIANFVPIKNNENLYPTRASVANVSYLNGDSKIDIINNRIYKQQNNDLDLLNLDFYKKTNKLENLLLDSSNNIYYLFNNIDDFCKIYNIKPTNNELCSFFNHLCGKDGQDKNIINDIISKISKLKIIVRILKLNTRIITENKTSTYDTIGKGNYSNNEQEFLLKDNILSIDIIPINTYYKSNPNDKNLVYRTRIFIPKMLLKKTGFIS